MAKGLRTVEAEVGGLPEVIKVQRILTESGKGCVPVSKVIEYIYLQPVHFTRSKFYPN